MADYWDTSAILKLFFSEPDSPWFESHLASRDEPAFSSIVASTELLCALLRKERELGLPSGEADSLFADFQSDCKAGRFVLVPNDGRVIQEAEKLAKRAYAEPKPILIRSLDLIHLASSSVAQASTLVTTDKRLRDLAVLHGMQVAP